VRSFFLSSFRSVQCSGAGVAGGNSLSFASPKESKQRKGDPTCCVPPLRCGQPAVLGSGGVSRKLASLKQARSLIRLNLRSSAHPEGMGKGIPIPNTKQPKTEPRIPEETRTRHGESLSVFVPVPDCPLWMRRGAQDQTDQGSCMFEPKASLHETPAGPSTAGCPGAKRRGRRNQGRLFFGDFLLAKQKKVTCRRATPGQQPSAKSTATKTRTIHDRPGPDRRARP
jgi:hypothetical protein